jgi:hypothetical protein
MANPNINIYTNNDLFLNSTKLLNSDDYTIYTKSLKQSYDKDPKSYVLVCKDNMISQYSNVMDIVYDIISSSSFDICYLSNYCDQCEKYTNRKKLTSNIWIVDTTKANGIDCLLFSPSGVEKFLNIKYNEKDDLNKILNNSLTTRLNPDNTFIGITTYPSLFVPDINKITNDADYIKTNRCLSVDGELKPSSSSVDLNLFLFVVVLIIISIIIYNVILFRKTFNIHNK